MELSRKFAGMLLLMAFCSAAWAQPAIRFSGEFSCCTEANGQRSCGDILPRECVGRAYTVYNRAGLRIRQVSAARSEEERAQAARREQEAIKEEAAAREQERRRLAISNTYASLADINQRQADSEAAVRRDISNSEQQIAAARVLIAEMESKLPAASATSKDKDKDKKKPTKADLEASIHTKEMEIKSQTELIKIKQKELDNIRARFEQDRNEYRKYVGDQ